jgi:hypothetical protein
MRYAAALLTLSILAAPAGAQPDALYKCDGGGGRVVYRSAGCGAGETALAAWRVARFTEPPAVQPFPRPDAAARPRSVLRAGGARAGRRAEPVDACQAARARRDEVERRVGLARTYELLAGLSRDVFDACR